MSQLTSPPHRGSLPLKGSVSRRGFLGLGSALGAGALLTLTGCGSSGSGARSSASTVRVLLPGTVPTGWDAVLQKVNQKLRKDTGLTLDAQFINWSKYQEQSLLKFTAGEDFDNALQALWLNMAQLQQDRALVDLTKEWTKYDNLSATLNQTLVESNSWDGKLWGIPQVNSAGRVQHFVVRQDLADKHGFSEISDFETLERFFYAVAEKERGIIPYGMTSANGYLSVIPFPIGMFNRASWEDPHTSAKAFTGRGLFFVFARDAAKTGSSAPVPFWEDESVVETLHRMRKYYQDGIVNKDAINVDSSTIGDQWAAGKYASAWTMTDGSSSNVLPQLRKAVPGATVANVMPLAEGLDAKPNQTFQADNLVVVNANGGDLGQAMTLQDWVSVKANHDLIEYGIEGRDWKAIGEDRFEALGDYSFPGFALCWRASLERKTSYMTESEERIFAWAQDYDNFTVDPFASFVPDTKSVEKEIAAMESVVTQYANPLYYGTVEVKSGLDKLKRAAEAAGLDKLRAAMAEQADAYLAANR